VARARPILIVDADPHMREHVSGLFARAGLATVEATSGEEALAAARREQPGLVLVDVGLPDVNGYEVCRELRDQFGDDLPVVFLSGERTEPIDRAAGLLVGGDDYIVEPFDSDELVARVRRLLARSRREQTALPANARPLDLTTRELQVLSRLALGRRPAEIAEELVISRKTVSSHMQRVFAKLGVHTQAQAVACAYEHGLIGVVRGRDDEAGDVDLHRATRHSARAVDGRTIGRAPSRR
jgi:DNA-binding NarL/FixJ family response regulator